MDIEHTEISQDAISFIISKNLKTTRFTKSMKIISCPTTKEPSLNLSDYIIFYMNKTIPYRAAAVERGEPKPTQLLLSYKTKAPVAKQTISRWMREILKMADIDTSHYGPHSFRGAGLSAAKLKGASTEQLIKAGDWTNARTFNTYYDKPQSRNTVINMILNNSTQ